MVLCTLFGLIACNPIPDKGIVAVGPSDDSTIAKQLTWGVETFPYSSQDGGLTWAPRDTAGDNYQWLRAIVQEQDAVSTPRGVYEAIPSGVVLHTGSERKTVYSTAHLESSINLWLQAKKTKHLEYRDPTTRPYSLAYDPNSGNVIAAMGLMGVTVGKPDGSWTPAAVGPYAPVDFSALAKVKTLLSELNFWASASTLPLSMVAATLFFPRLFKETGCSELPLALLVVTSVVISTVLLGWTGGTHFGSGFPELEILGTGLLWGLAILTASPTIAAALTGPQRIPLRPVVVGYAAMAGVVALSLFAWLLAGWSFTLSAFLAVVLCIGTAAALGRHVYLVLPERERRTRKASTV